MRAICQGRTISILESNNTQTEVTLDELRARNIAMPPVPYLANGTTNHPNNNPVDITANATAAAANEAAANAEKETLREQLEVQSGHVLTLEKQLTDLKAMVDKMQDAEANTPAPASPKRKINTAKSIASPSTEPRKAKRSRK